MKFVGFGLIALLLPVTLHADPVHVSEAKKQDMCVKYSQWLTIVPVESRYIADSPIMDDMCQIPRSPKS
jgi:hypothetical protein